MSVKALILIVALGGAIYFVARAEPPAQTTVVSGDSVVVAKVTFGDRLMYSIGSVGSAVVGSSVRKSVMDTEQSLADLKKAIKTAKGGDGVRARDLARKIMYMDSVAIESLHQGHPIKAMKQSVEAKSLLNSVRHNLKQGV
jgi:hypothetical protein